MTAFGAERTLCSNRLERLLCLKCLAGATYKPVEFEGRDPNLMVDCHSLTVI